MDKVSSGTLRRWSQVRKSATESSLGSFPGPDRSQAHSLNSFSTQYITCKCSSTW
jgi:hypothetical protein